MEQVPNFWDILDKQWQTHQITPFNGRWMIYSLDYPTRSYKYLSWALRARRYRIAEQIIETYQLPLNAKDCASDPDFELLRNTYNGQKITQDELNFILAGTILEPAPA